MGVYRVSVEDINQFVACCLAGITFPMTSEKLLVKEQKWHTMPFDFGDFITNVCSLQTNKFVEVMSAPFLR